MMGVADNQTNTDHKTDLKSNTCGNKYYVNKLVNTVGMKLSIFHELNLEIQQVRHCSKWETSRSITNAFVH
jgi:hypothetical protein